MKTLTRWMAAAMRLVLLKMVEWSVWLQGCELWRVVQGRAPGRAGKVQQRVPGVVAVIVLDGLDGLRSAEVDKLVEVAELARDAGCRMLQVSVLRGGQGRGGGGMDDSQMLFRPGGSSIRMLA